MNKKHTHSAHSGTLCFIRFLNKKQEAQQAKELVVFMSQLIDSFCTPKEEGKTQ